MPWYSFHPIQVVLCYASPSHQWIPAGAPRQDLWVSIAEEKQTMLLLKSWLLNLSAGAWFALPRNRYQNPLPKTLIDKKRIIWTRAGNQRRGFGYVANQRYEIQTVKFLKWIYSEISEMLRRHRKGNAVKEVCSKTEQKRLVCLSKYSSRFYPQWVYLM